ncbi:MAG: hypothetical protein NTY68_01280 [Candidatus Micrarchaeota archaeon]|nr:hypothetical protein [Candidatus Micrarchaeota archaeon]
MNMEFPNVFEVPSIGMGNFTLVFLLFIGFFILVMIALLWLMFKKRT